MLMIFEDADESPVAELIKLAYRNNDLKIKFAGGSGMFYGIVRDIKDECVVIFYDLVPDNSSTAKGFKDLRRKLRHYDNIFVVPILSLDYMILKAYTSVEVDPEKCIDKYTEDRIASLEKYYKYLLDTYLDCLSLGRYSDLSDKSTVFYKRGCLCSGYKDKCRAYSLDDKAYDLVCLFPCRYTDDIIPFKSRFNYTEYTDAFLSKHNYMVDSISIAWEWDINRIDRSRIKVK